MSAIDAIIQPFQFKSNSTQTHSTPKVINLGGKEVTVFSLAQNKSITRVVGGVLMSVSHRIRTGKTKKDKASNQ